MPEYELTVLMVDAANRQTTKKYISQDLADFDAATTAAAALITDLEAVSEGRCLSRILSHRYTLADTVVAGANVDEGATLTLRKADNYKATHKIPMPVAAIRRADGTIDIENALVTDYVANFLSAGDWTVSDGEVVTEIIGGTLDK